MELLRGKVYLAALGTAQPKYWLVVSNNHRNANLDNVLVVRITSTQKYENLDSVVAIPSGEFLSGFVRCDSLTQVWREEIIREAGAFSPATMTLVSDGLKAALGI